VRSVEVRAGRCWSKRQSAHRYFRQQSGLNVTFCGATTHADAVRIQGYPAGFALALLLGRTGIAARGAQNNPCHAATALGYNGGDNLDPRLQAALAADLKEGLLRIPVCSVTPG